MTPIRSIVLVLVLCGCGANPVDAVTINPNELATGLVAHWTFDEGTGTVAADRSGNRHDGQLTGGSWLPSGRFAGALDLAAGDYVTVSTFPQATPAWTVSAWVRTSAEQLVAGASQGWKTILSTENVFAGGWQLYLDIRSDFKQFDAAYWAGTSATDYVVANCDCVEVGQWIHLTAVFDDISGELRFYRDEALMDRRAMPVPILAGDPTLYIGRWNQDGRFLAASLDDVAIWSRALDAAEIAVLSRQPAP